jgi:hypothetical protein
MFRTVALVACLSGCSIALQSKPSHGVAHSNDCSTSHIYWAADAVGTAGGVGAIAYGVSDMDDQTKMTIAGIGAIGAVLYLASAANGFRARRECASSAPITAAR